MAKSHDTPAQLKGWSNVVATAKGMDAMVNEVRAHLIEPRAIAVVDGALANVSLQKRAFGEPDTSTGSNQIFRDDYATAFTMFGAIDPVYDPEMLALLFEHSNSLRQNVDAYGVNIDGFGHRFDPVFDFEAQNIDQRIGDAMFEDRQRALDATGKDEDAIFPTDEEIVEEKKRIERRMRREKVRLHNFFEYCAGDESFVTLRRKTRQDLEVTGNGYWEVLKNGAGEIAQFTYIASFTMRLLPLDPYAVKRTTKRRVSDLSFDTIEQYFKLRRYVQVIEGRAVFFKELGDPRVMSSQTGIEYETVEEMWGKENPKVKPANEILHFKIHSPRSPYGVPRWIGNLLAVIGSRQAEEVNFNYFENKSVPPLAILVSGGRMSSGSVERVQDYIEANLKGKRNFHKILVLEAEGSGGNQNDANASRMKIQIQPLTGAQHNDALFQVYDERNMDKVGQSFRLSRMLRGDIRDFNRSTSEAALVFAEMQVFEPERQEFDVVINRKILPLLDTIFWKMVSLAPVMRDPKAMSEIIKNLMNANILTPEEARELAGDVFNREFRRLSAKWTKQPPALTIAGVPFEEEPREKDPTQPSAPTAEANWSDDKPDGSVETPEAEGIQARWILKSLRNTKVLSAKRITEIRDALRASEQEEWFQEMMKAAKLEAEKV